MEVLLRYLACDPATLGDVELLVVGPPELDLVVRAGAGGAGVARIGPVGDGPGACRLELSARFVDVIDHEAEVVDAGVLGLVSRALARSLLSGFQDRQVDVPVGQIATRPGLA